MSSTDSVHCCACAKTEDERIRFEVLIAAARDMGTMKANDDIICTEIQQRCADAACLLLTKLFEDETRPVLPSMPRFQ